MINISILSTLTLAGIFATGAVFADPIRIASWNIANFHHAVGVEVRPDIGTKRYPSDFTALKAYADIVNADVIALQEIATYDAAAMLYPEPEYSVYMSSRYWEDMKNRKGNDIYTAIAVKNNSSVSVIEQKDLVELEINWMPSPEANSHVSPKPMRRGTALRLNINGELLWVMSVHLKSSCSKVRKLHQSKQTSCQMLWQQRIPLKRWITSRQSLGQAFVIAGDFNRRFGQLKDRGLLWSYLKSDDNGKKILFKYPSTGLRRCPTRKGKSTQPIDWIVMDQQSASRVVGDSFWETRWSYLDANQHRNRLSDHCPIHLDILY